MRIWQSTKIYLTRQTPTLCILIWRLYCNKTLKRRINGRPKLPLQRMYGINKGQNIIRLYDLPIINSYLKYKSIIVVKNKRNSAIKSWFVEMSELGFVLSVASLITLYNCGPQCERKKRLDYVFLNFFWSKVLKDCLKKRLR